jgi:hypothetical protein
MKTIIGRNFKNIDINEWYDGINEWSLAHPYPSLKKYSNSLVKRRNKRNDIEFDQEIGLHLPSTFKHRLQHIKQHHAQRLEQDDYLPPHISLNSNHSNLNLLNNSEASNLLFKELHKLVSGQSSSLNKGSNGFQNGSSNLNSNYNNNHHHHQLSNNNQLDPLIRTNSGTNSLSKKLLSIKPPSIPNNLINSQILNSNINNTNSTANHIYSQLQLRSDELDRVKTHVSSSSTQNKLNNSNSSSLLQLTDFLKNTSTKVAKPPQTNHVNEQYSSDDISLLNLNRKSGNYNIMNSSFEFGTTNIANGSEVLNNNNAIQIKTNDYQRANLPYSQTQRKVFLQKSESDSSIKQAKNITDQNTSDSNSHQSNANPKILKVT